MKRKKEGPDIWKQSDPRCKAEAEHLLELKIKEVQSQQSKLLFLFVESQPPVVTESMLNTIWRFMKFLSSNDYHIISGKELFCFPFSHEVRRMPNSIGKNRREPKGRRFVYHTHYEAWGCIYDTTRDNEAVVIVNEVGQPGLTRRIANRLNAGKT